MIDNRMTGHRHKQPWFECDFCGFQYPQAKIVVQNGLKRCTGPSTNNCVDKPGYRANMNKVRFPIERRDPPLPNFNEDL